MDKSREYRGFFVFITDFPSYYAHRMAALKMKNDPSWRNAYLHIHRHLQLVCLVFSVWRLPLAQFPCYDKHTY